MKAVILTGGTGYIGTEAIPYLRSLQFSIHALTSRPIEKCPVIDGVTWHSIDLLKEIDFRIFDEIKPTHLLHLAWFAEPGKFWNANENTTWVSASLRLLTAFARVGGRRAVFAGTGAEYDWTHGYCTEAVTPCAPITLYGTCKLALEKIVFRFADLNKICASTGRVFWLYGGKEYASRLVPSIILPLAQGKRAPCSSGAQIRDFMHVRDVASAFAAVLNSSVSGPVNICSGIPISVREIVEEIGRQMAAQDRIDLGAIPLLHSESPLVVGNSRRLVTEVNWKPAITLEEGIRETICLWKSLI